jgi:hypothetical protein
MTTNNPQTRILVRLATCAGFVALLVVAGCKSKDGDQSIRKGDPLVYGPNRIPPQNVPLPDRGSIGSTGTKNDPLLDRPVSKNGSGYSDTPDRFKNGPFIPGLGTTPAALASTKGRDEEELKIASPDNRVPLRTGGVQPAAAIEADAGLASLYTDLAKYGVKPDSRTLSHDESGEFTFRASVPISGEGAKREYTGVGKTPSEAVKQVLEQVELDRK